jgi:CheY-like chemotaxis protein
MSTRRESVILIVDDDDAIRDLLSRLMCRLGIKTLTAANGAEGVIVYEAHANEIDAIMLDAVMPVMDGGEALYEIRRRGARQPAIAISGQQSCEIARIFSRERPDEVLAKPCTIDDLLRTLSKWNLVPKAQLVAS